MPEDKSTPEEKLLRLIENPAQAKGVKQSAGKSLVKKNKFNFFALFSPVKLITGIKQLFKVKDKLKPYIFNFKFINRCFTGLAVLIALYLVFDFIKGRPTLNKIYDSTAAVFDTGISRLKAGLGIKAAEISDYLAQIERRDIFHLMPLKKEEKPPETKQIFSALLADLKLVGIIWSAKPQVMIEDKKENKTLLLNQGDFIGKIKLKQILRDKVIVTYEDQEMELL